VLESGRGIGESLGNHQPLERAVAGPECGFCLVSLGYSDEMVGVPEVDFRVDASLAGCIEEVRNEREGIAILLR